MKVKVTFCCWTTRTDDCPYAVYVLNELATPAQWVYKFSLPTREIAELTAKGMSLADNEPATAVFEGGEAKETHEIPAEHVEIRKKLVDARRKAAVPIRGQGPRR